MVESAVLKSAHEPQSILIVEDSEDDFYATRRALSKANVQTTVERAASGEAALTYLRRAANTRPDLILLDLNMPGMDGRKTLEFIKQEKELKLIPVIVLTTSDDVRDIEACYTLGANTYIQKPVDFDGLIDTMRCLREYWFKVALLPN